MNARDCDVLIERLKKQQSGRGDESLAGGGPGRASRNRRAAVVAVYERLWHGDRFTRRIDKLLKRIRSRGEEKTTSETGRFGEWARTHFRPVVERFFAAVPADQTDEAALHQFRICGKQLRYDMELLAGAFSDEFRTQLYPTIEAMQDRLGEINDLATAKARLQQKDREAASDPKKAAAWRQLLTNEQAQLNQAREQFWQWCVSAEASGPARRIREDARQPDPASWGA